jgi:hypothetical protein
VIEKPLQPPKKKKKTKRRANLLDAVDGKEEVDDDIQIDETEIDFLMELMNKNKKGSTRNQHDSDDDDSGKRKRSKKRKRSDLVTREEVYEILRQRKLEERNSNGQPDQQSTKQNDDDIIEIDDSNLDLPSVDIGYDLNMGEIEHLLPEMKSRMQVLKDLDNLIESSTQYQITSSNRLRAAKQEEEKKVEQHFSQIAQTMTESPTNTIAVVDDEVEDRGEKIGINVRCGQTETLKFNLGMNDPFEKLINGVSKKKGLPKDKIKLVFDGSALNPKQTPEDLDMEDDDLVELKIL